MILELDGFDVPHTSPLTILRDGELVTVKWGDKQERKPQNIALATEAGQAEQEEEGTASSDSDLSDSEEEETTLEAPGVLAIPVTKRAHPKASQHLIWTASAHGRFFTKEV